MKPAACIFLILAIISFFSCSSIGVLENGLKVDLSTYSESFDENTKTRKYTVTIVGNWTEKNGMVLKKGTKISVQEPGGILLHCTLAEDWKYSEKGFTIAADTYLDFYPNGNFEIMVLKYNWKDSNGIDYLAGKRVCFYESGRIHYFTPASEWKDKKWGFLLLSGKEQELYDSGAYKEIFLASDFEYGETGIVIAGEKLFAFYENGNISSFTLARDFKNEKSGAVMAGGKTMHFYKSGELKQYTLAEDHALGKDSAVMKKGTSVTLKEDGTVAEATFANPWKDPKTGVSYEADKPYKF